MSKKKQRVGNILKNNLLMIKKIAEFSPSYFAYMVIIGIIYGAWNASYTIFTYTLLNTIDEGGDFLYAVKVIVVMAVVITLFSAYEALYHNVINPLVKQRLRLRMHEELFVKARSLDLSCFDDPEFYNDFIWAMEQSDNRAIQVADDVQRLIQSIVSLSLNLGILLSIDPLVAIILFASSGISVAATLIDNKIEFNKAKIANPLHRKSSYINRVYHLADYAKELRIRHASELIMSEYDDNMEKIIDLDKKYAKKIFLFRGALGEELMVLTQFIIILYMMRFLADGSLLVGGFAAALNVIWNVRWNLQSFVSIFTKFPQHSLYIEQYKGFLQFEPSIKGENKSVPEFESLEFKNVSFSYEFSSHPKYQFHDDDHKSRIPDAREALRDVSLTIRKGDKAAIVGYNGAGKTTLIKLIMRLYDPTEGEILYNGVNIKEYDPEAYREKIGTVFQDFKIFATSIAENVMNGPFDTADEQKVIDALAASDFTDKLESLEEGINTHLTREFNDKGTNLSGGESQKVVIARVFARDYPIVIMDEPSSALDPNAEYKLNQSILDKTESKTVIFISHRLSTTRVADKIYMFDTGRLIEEGSHDALMALNGKYAEMFKVQSEKYKAVSSN